MKKLSIIAIIVISVGAILMFKRPKVEKITYHKTELKVIKDHTVYVDALGQIRASKENYLSVVKGGRLDKLLVKEGETVVKGQIIAIVNETMNKAELESALSSYNLAAKEYERTKRLRGSRSVSKQELDKAKSDFLIKKAELKISKQGLEDSLITSMFDGTIAFIAFQEGDIIPNGSRVVVVEDQINTHIDLKIPRVNGHLTSKHFASKIELIKYDLHNMESFGLNTQVETKINILNFDSRYRASEYDLRITLPKLPESYKVGQSVQVKIPVQTHTRVFAIPADEIHFDADGSYVLINGQNGKKSFAAVKIIERKGTDIIIAPIEAETIYALPSQKSALKKIQKI